MRGRIATVGSRVTRLCAMSSLRFVVLLAPRDLAGHLLTCSAVKKCRTQAIPCRRRSVSKTFPAVYVVRVFESLPLRSHGWVRTGPLDWTRPAAMRGVDRLAPLSGPAFAVLFGDHGGAQAAVDQELGEGPAEGVAHDDRRTVQALDHLAEMVKRFGDGRLGDDLGFFTQRLHLDLESRVRRHDDLMPLRPVILHLAVPTPGGHPRPMDQHDRLGIG